MQSINITFDQLPHVVGGLSEKLDRVLELLEQGGKATHSKEGKPERRIVHAKEACAIIGKSLSSLYRHIKARTDPLPSYKRGKLLYFFEDELYEWIEKGRKQPKGPTFEEQMAAMTAGMKRRPRGGYKG